MSDNLQNRTRLSEPVQHYPELSETVLKMSKKVLTQF